MKAMIVNRVGDVGIIMAIGLLYAEYNTVEYGVILTMAQPGEVT